MRPLYTWAVFCHNRKNTASRQGLARFFIKPVKREVEGDAPDHADLEIELWRGPLTKELSEIIATAAFPLSQAGLEETVRWLEEQAAQLNG